MKTIDAFLIILKTAFVLFCGMADGADLTHASFQYEGSVTVPGVGMSSQALAYRDDTDTFLVIAADGNLQYALKEFRVVSGATSTTLVRSWGNLNVDNRLAVTGALVQMRGLHYDSALHGVWCSFGSFYANGANNPVLAFAALDDATGTFTLHGPWRVNSATHSDTVKGKLIEYGVDFLAFGERGSTAQLQSWGPGLVSLRRPLLTTLPHAEMPSQRIVHWPMKSSALGGVSVGWSDCPRLSGKSVTNINGPASAPIFTVFTTYHQADSVNTVSLIDDTFVWTGCEARGYAWYGQPTLYDSLQLDSLVYPGQKVKSANAGQGNHAEQFVPQIHFMRRADVIAAYNMGGNQKVGFYQTADLQTLGGTVPMAQARCTGTYVNQPKRLFYAINPGLANQAPKLHKWSIAP